MTDKVDVKEVSEPGNDELRPAEQWWRDHYELFEAHGYRLRSRYRPGWIPPWTVEGKGRILYEEHYWCLTDNVMHATRINDGTVVSIKRVFRKSKELSIALFLSQTSENAVEPRNHCVPILDHFFDDTLPENAFLVMPLLRQFDRPPFFAVDEVLDFMKQTLEGLSYMHSRCVAHRDCARMNIMLDASSMYPRGFHPVAQLMDPSGTRLTPYRRRRDVRGVKYYFIDFGISSQFQDNVRREDRLVTGVHCQDRDVPELSYDIPYDPFSVDVFILGNLFRKSFLNSYTNFAFLSDLIQAMTAKNPGNRPSADEALAQFDKLVATQPRFRTRWSLKEKDAGLPSRVFVDIASVIREGAYISRQFIRKVVTTPKVQPGRGLLRYVDSR